MFSSLSRGFDLTFFTPPDWIFSKVVCDKLDLISGDFEFFLNNLPDGERSCEAEANLEEVLTFGVDNNFDAERSLGEEVLADMLRR